MKEMEREQMSQDELKRMRRMSYIKMVAMGGIVAAVIAFSSIAWFTMSREVESSGVQMTADNISFELRTEGSGTGGTNAVKNGFDTLFGLISGDYKENTASPSGTNITDGTADQIRWYFDDTDATGEGIGPGSSGKMTFFVVPKSSGELTVTFNLSLEGYYSERTLQEPEDEDDTRKIYDVTALTPISSSSDETKSLALEYLRGHILFFEDADETTVQGKTVYSNYSGLIEGEFVKDKWTNDSTTVTKNVKEEVNIYWVWPNTFSEMALIDGDSALESSMNPLAESTDTHNALVDYIRSNTTTTKNRIFSGDSNYSSIINQRNAPEEGQTEGTLKDLCGANLTTNQLIALSEGYNAADSKIGNHVHYMLLVLSAK